MASILWFRKVGRGGLQISLTTHHSQGLRLHDNPALIEAASATHMYPIFIIDPFFLKTSNYRCVVHVPCS